MKSSFKILSKQYRSSRRKVLYKKVVDTNSAKLTGKHLCWSLSFIKLRAGDLQLYQKRECFPVQFSKLLRTRVFKNTCKRLFLKAPILDSSKYLRYIYLLTNCVWYPEKPFPLYIISLFYFYFLPIFLLPQRDTALNIFWLGFIKGEKN